jgi:hypothetical protein
VSGKISEVIGTFSSVSSGPSSGASEYGENPTNKHIEANTFSLQISSNQFSTPLCAGHAKLPNVKCLGWEQFVYLDSGTQNEVMIQDWINNYGPHCPSGAWKQSHDSCVEFSNVVTLSGSRLTVAELAGASLIGRAQPGGNDEAMLFTPSGSAIAIDADSVLGLGKVWKAAEFGIFGDASLAEAEFSPGTTITVQTEIEGTDTKAPKCIKGTTGETNNLNTEGTPALAPQLLPTIASQQTNGNVTGNSCASIGIESSAEEVKERKKREAEEKKLEREQKKREAEEVKRRIKEQEEGKAAPGVTVSPVGDVDGPVGYGGVFSGPKCGSTGETGVLSVFADQRLLFSYLVDGEFSVGGWQYPLTDTDLLSAGTHELSFECWIMHGSINLEEWSAPGFPITLTGTARHTQAATSAPQGGHLKVFSGLAEDPCPVVGEAEPEAAYYDLLAANKREYLQGGYTTELSADSFEALLPSDLTSGETSSVLASCIYYGNASFDFVEAPFSVSGAQSVRGVRPSASRFPRLSGGVRGRAPASDRSLVEIRAGTKREALIALLGRRVGE